MKPLSLYFHIPFCVRKCAYCDFASYPGREGEMRQYFDKLLEEIEHWSGLTDSGPLSERFFIRTIFIGGGTPTIVDAGHIAEIIDRGRSIAPVAGDIEITLEGNPGTLTPEKLTVAV